MDQREQWFRWVYLGNKRQRQQALKLLAEDPGVLGDDGWGACAVGDIAGVQRAIQEDREWVNQAGGPLGMKPLLAVTHSMLIREKEFEDGLIESAQALIAAGADVNARWTDPEYPQWPLSACYGAAGKTHKAAMLRVLLDAGVDPNDGESVYHSVEGPDGVCTRMLLEAGARLQGTNCVAHALDYGRLEDVRMILSFGSDGNEARWIFHAILRARTIEFVRLLADSGADLRARNDSGISLFQWAKLFGREDVVALLEERGVTETLTPDWEFLSACSRGDEAAARATVADEPGIWTRLSAGELALLPAQAGLGNMTAVRTMLAVGWPLEAKGGWGATALNQAVYRGDAAMAKVLLDAGADWRTTHDFKDNVVGTLAWASKAEGEDPSWPRDFVGCARVLLESGVPASAFEGYEFSLEVEAFLAGWKSGF